MLIVPHVFNRAFCDRLIDLHETDGGREIGSIEDKGQIVKLFDPAFRRRRDYYYRTARRSKAAGRRLNAGYCHSSIVLFNFPLAGSRDILSAATKQSPAAIFGHTATTQRRRSPTAALRCQSF